MKKLLVVLGLVLGISLCTLSQSYTITTIAGNGYGSPYNGGYSGDGGLATTSELYWPCKVVLDSTGNIYIGDYGNARTREINTNGIISTFAGNGVWGYYGNGGQATAAELYYPSGIAIDHSGNIYIADMGNEVIRKVNTNGIISTIAGTGAGGFSGDGGLAINAMFYDPEDVALDGIGNIYIADNGNNRIRKINTSGIISTYAGGGHFGLGDGGQADSAELYAPTGVATDNINNIYIADANHNRVRKINSSNIISTFAGNGIAGYSGNGGAAGSAEVNIPLGVAIDMSGNVFIADNGNNRIREVNTSGIISTIAGDGIAGYSGDGGAATLAKLDYPFNVTVDKTGHIYIADYLNDRIRKLIPVCALSLTISIIQNVTCCGDSNASATANPSNGTSPFTYTWLTNPTQTNATATGLKAGTYTVTVQDANSCTGTASVTITQPNALNASANLISNATCYGVNDGSASSTISGGTSPYTYLWSNSATISTISALTAGTYTLLATDNNSCTATASVTVTQPQVLTATITSVINGSCYGSNNGSIICTGSGGTLIDNGYLVSWTGGLSGDPATNVPPGTYTVTLTDANGCTATAAATVTQPTPISIITDSTSDNGTCNGEAGVTTSGGTSPYTYSWTGGGTNDSIQNKCAGSYCCIISDANGCVDSVCVTVPLIIETGTKPLQTNNLKLKINPNPNNGNFIITMNGETENALIEIYDILGQKVLESTIKPGNTELSLSNEAKGMYLYIARTLDGKLIGTGKFIIQ